MIFTSQRVPASGPTTAKLMAIGMSPAKNEIAEGKPFVGYSGRIFNDALTACKVPRAAVYVTNVVGFYVDDNDLYSVPEEILRDELRRVHDEIDHVKPNVLFIMGAQTLTLLMEGYVGAYNSKTQKKAAAKWGITKWRGSIITLALPSGRVQKCVVAMHPAGFIRGQWKWLPLFKYVDVPRAVTQSSFPEMNLTPRRSIVGPSYRTAVDYLREANEKDWIAIDYEGRGHITCLGVGWTRSEALCIPMSRVGNPSYWELEEEINLWKLWCELLQNPRVQKIAQNAAYEWIKSWIYGIYPAPLGIDTMHLHHALYPDFGGVDDEWTRKKRAIDNPGHGLALITSQYTDQPYYKDDGRHWEPSLGEEVFWRYNALDVMVTYESAMTMKEEAQNAGLWETYNDLYQESFENAIRIEWEGIAIDVGSRDSAKLVSAEKIIEFQKILKEATGLEVISKAGKGVKPKAGVLNLASPKQMMEWLTKVKRYAARIDKRSGKPTIDEDTLKMLAIKHKDPALDTILEMKKEQRFINNILNMPLDANGRTHCHVKLGGTNGTRWSTTESILGTGTNLQNLDRTGVARRLFLPS